MHFGIKDLIDVLLVAYFLYQTYKLMKSSGAFGDIQRCRIFYYRLDFGIANIGNAADGRNPRQNDQCRCLGADYFVPR